MYPVLYSFRRCPYAMRARMGLRSAGITCELREIVLRDKAPQFLEASHKGTVPVLVTEEGVLEESLDILLWALERNDPENLLDTPPEGMALISESDGPFKTALDRYKYHTRHDSDPEKERERASEFVRKLETKLAKNAFLYGDSARLADLAIAPFIRQFANTDRTWFDAQAWPNTLRWLNDFQNSDRFAEIMTKYPKWEEGDPVTLFG
ncbi:MAG: glutathione S-transferase [Paracoccaceae bacterium]